AGAAPPPRTPGTARRLAGAPTARLPRRAAARRPRLPRPLGAPAAPHHRDHRLLRADRHAARSAAGDRRAHRAPDGPRGPRGTGGDLLEPEGRAAGPGRPRGRGRRREPRRPLDRDPLDPRGPPRDPRLAHQRHRPDLPALAGMRDGPSGLVQASAIGFYGPRRPGELLTEADRGGEGFLAD